MMAWRPYQQCAFAAGQTFHMINSSPQLEDLHRSVPQQDFKKFKYA